MRTLRNVDIEAVSFCKTVRIGDLHDPGGRFYEVRNDPREIADVLLAGFHVVYRSWALLEVEDKFAGEERVREIVQRWQSDPWAWRKRWLLVPSGEFKHSAVLLDIQRRVEPKMTLMVVDAHICVVLKAIGRDLPRRRYWCAHTEFGRAS